MTFKKVVAYKLINNDPFREKIIFNEENIDLCTHNENSATGDNEMWICNETATEIYLKLYNYKIIGIYANIIKFLAYSEKGEKIFISAF